MDMNFKSHLLKTFNERGYIYQCTNFEALDEMASKETVVTYIGFDCTAKSLHVGSLVQIMMLRTMQKCGHKPIIIMGGATTKIGDPTGKDETRRILSDQDIEDNKESLKKIFAKFIKFGDGPTDAIMVDNSEWFAGMGYIDFLRRVGRLVTVNRMLSFDSVKIRLEREDPLTFLEFNYMLLQGYDFVELYKRYNCKVQMGGSDQWGNIVSGVDLGHKIEGADLFGLTSPLVTTKSGAKMGKTVSGAVWLNADMFSPYDYWQFWRNTEDGDVERFLRLFTELPDAEVKRLAALEGKDINEAKIVLANEATTMCHSREAAEEAYKTAVETFEKGSAGADLPIYNVDAKELEAGIPAFKLFNMCGLCDSGGAARRLIAGKGAKINNETVPSETHLITSKDITAEGYIKLSAGQKKHTLVMANK